jgi:uncharacterized protein YllA (UPF0747 family)
MSESQQTAVGWIEDNIQSDMTFMEIMGLIRQAKEIEKEQIEEAFSIGEMNNDSHHYTGRKIHQDQTDYFNKTYSK